MENEIDQDCASMLIVDDDRVFCEVLAEALERRGFSVRVAHSVSAAIALAQQAAPEYAVVDLNMPGESGLQLVQALKQLDENTQIVMLTGYASVSTAVEAIKLGAVHYLAKPADADEILAAFQKDRGDADVPVPDKPLSVARLEW